MKSIIIDDNDITLRAYSKRAVQPISAVQKLRCAVQTCAVQDVIKITMVHYPIKVRPPKDKRL